jgi:hypothetical protein
MVRENTWQKETLKSIYNIQRGYDGGGPVRSTLQFPNILRVALHLEAMPNPLEANCMKFQPFLGWRPASTSHYNKIITWSNFPICKGLRAKKLGRYNKSSIIQRI